MMPLTPKMFLIVCPLLFLAGFVDSIAGGGGLISLPAYLFAGLPVHAAVATNKLSGALYPRRSHSLEACPARHRGGDGGLRVRVAPVAAGG